MIQRIGFLALVVSAATTTVAPAGAAQGRIIVYRDRGCGCCEGWVAALQSSGYRVDLVDLDHAERLQRFQIPESLASCHTAQLDGYSVEGHVPMPALEKLRRERPHTRGLALPGMPSGTPGMPGPKGPIRVVLLDRPNQVYYNE